MRGVFMRPALQMRGAWVEPWFNQGSTQAPRIPGHLEQQAEHLHWCGEHHQLSSNGTSYITSIRYHIQHRITQVLAFRPFYRVLDASSIEHPVSAPALKPWGRGSKV
jgi:hypothetical protein